MNQSSKLVTIILVSGISLFLLLVFVQPERSKIQIQEKEWSIDGQSAEKKSNTPNIVLFGQIKPPIMTKIESALSADITQIAINQGESVKKGQPLLYLENQDFERLVQQKSADLDEVDARIKSENLKHQAEKQTEKEEVRIITIKEASLKRQEALFSKKSISNEKFDRTRESLANQKLALINRQFSIENFPNIQQQLSAQRVKAQMALAQAKKNLERTIIRAPFDGKITKIYTALGSKAKPGQPLLEMYNVHQLEAEVIIPLQYLPMVQKTLEDPKKDEAFALVNQQPLNLELLRLSGYINRNDGGIEAYFKIVTQDISLTVGQTIELSLPLLPIANSIRVPEDAIYDNQNIFIVRNQRLKSIPIQKAGHIYLNGKTFAVITSDSISNNDTILINQLPFARSGLKVKTHQANYGP